MRSGEETAEVRFMVCVVDFVRIIERKREFKIYSLGQPRNSPCQRPERATETKRGRKNACNDSSVKIAELSE